MLAAVKGVYEKGVIKPLEPISLNGRGDAIITFFALTDTNRSFESSAGAWLNRENDKLNRMLYSRRSLVSRPEPVL